MNETIDITVVAPVFNEVENLPLLRDRLRTALERIEKKWEVILVNDGSTDGSREALDRIANEDKRFKIVHFRRNSGQTAAMMAGFDFARGEIVVPIDADLQNDPEDIPKLLAKLDEGFDVVSGWRKDRQDHAIKRNLPSRMANFLISSMTGVHLHDYGCSLKAYRKAVVEDVKLYGEMHRFIPIYATWAGARVTEVPVRHYPRIHGESKYGLERVVKVLLDLIVVIFLSKFAQKPMYIFGGFGMISLGVGTLAGAAALYYKFWGGRSFIQTPLPMLFVMCFITGIMCFLLGLVAELLVRTYYESQSKTVYLVRELRNID